MASFNRIIMVGNLTKDPELKQIGGGQAVCRLSIASNRQFKNKQSGAMVQEVCYIDVDVWGAQAESANQYLQKGRPVLVEGRLKYDTWRDAEGNNKQRHSIAADRIVFLGSKQDGSEMKEESSEPGFATAESKGGVSGFEGEEAKSAPARGKKRSGGEAEFKDTPPFSDELPF